MQLPMVTRCQFICHESNRYYIAKSQEECGYSTHVPSFHEGVCPSGGSHHIMGCGCVGISALCFGRSVVVFAMMVVKIPSSRFCQSNHTCGSRVEENWAITKHVWLLLLPRQSGTTL